MGIQSLDEKNHESHIKQQTMILTLRFKKGVFTYIEVW